MVANIETTGREQGSTLRPPRVKREREPFATHSGKKDTLRTNTFFNVFHVLFLSVSSIRTKLSHLIFVLRIDVLRFWGCGPYLRLYTQLISETEEGHWTPFKD